MKEFENLRMSNYFSMKDSLLSTDDIIEHALKNNQKTVSLTNLGKMSSSLSFYEKALKKGLKPIIGLDAYIENDLTVGDKNVSRILMLAKNEKGYKKLMELNSRAALENSISGDPAIKESWLKDGIKDIIALSGEDVENLFFSGFEDRREMSKEEMVELINTKSQYIEQYKTFFPDGFFLEVVRTGRKNEASFVRTMLNLSRKTGTPLVATQSSKFKNRSDFSSHVVRSALSLSEYASIKAGKAEYSRDQYLLSNQEMEELFSDIPETLENANIISKMCNLKINPILESLPEIQNPDLKLRELAEKGLNEKLKIYFPDEKEREKNRQQYVDRMNYELEIIKNKNFSSYFLVVSDLVNHSKDVGITVGLGRGSAVGSLVVNVIGITDIDPIKYDLYFERFLNPERNSMPDIDIDFPSGERKSVIDYLSEKYNKDGKVHVAQIGTTNIYKIKGALNAAIKTLDLNYDIASMLRKSVFKYERENTEEKFKDATFADILNSDQELREYANTHTTLSNVIKYIENNIGVPASISKHASGVVISNEEIFNFTPLVKSIQDGEVQYSTQYDKDELEKIGLIKFDILGLKNLDFTDEVVRKINKNKSLNEKPLNLDDLEYNDPKVYEIFKHANTGGVFQFESNKMKNLLLKVQADNFDDLIAANALIRPGPNKYIDDYAKRKLNKEQIHYIHPIMKQITGYTQGILIYQEQVMKAAQLIAGYTLGEAELLRKAISKKKTDIMASQKARFIQGAKKLHNIDEDTASKIFADIELFAEYGFNKAHSVAYAAISYRNAYLKRYYKEDFFITMLEKADRNEVEEMMADIYQNNFKLVNPDINKCDVNFKFNENKEIVYGLSNIKDMNETIAKKILKIRNECGQFNDIYDFCEKVGREDLDRKLFLRMINAGCFDNITQEGNTIEEKRSLLIANIDQLIDFSSANSRVKKEKGFILNDLFGQEGLFKYAKKPYSVDFDPVERPKIAPPVDEEGQLIDYLFSENEIAEKEAEVLGVSLAINPLDKFIQQLEGVKPTVSLLNMNQMDTNDQLFFGIITDRKELVTKKGKPFLILSVFDGTIKQELTVFNEYKMKKIMELGNDEFISFKKFTNEAGYNNLDEVRDLEETKYFLSKKLNIATTSENMVDIVNILKKHKGDKMVAVFSPEFQTNTYSMLNLPIKVKITKELENELLTVLKSSKFISYEYNHSFKYEPKLKNDYNSKYNPKSKVQLKI